MEPTIQDLEKMLKDNKEAYKQVQQIKQINKEKYTRKKYVNNFKNKKVKVIKLELPKGNALY